MQGRFFADQAVKFSQVPAFRAEHFPYAGPYPWLDRPDALERIDEKLRHGELTEQEAEQCRCWSRHGYIIVKKLVDDQALDTVWTAYEKAIASGRIRLEPEPAGDGDPYNDLVMKREGLVFTVSISSIQLEEDKGSMKYIDMNNHSQSIREIDIAKAPGILGS